MELKEFRLMIKKSEKSGFLSFQKLQSNFKKWDKEQFQKNARIPPRFGISPHIILKEGSNPAKGGTSTILNGGKLS